MQIVVLGMHRSGTSTVARLLNLMGAYFGGENSSTSANDNVWRAQDEQNKKGFWERLDVRALNDSILHNANCDWDRIADFEPDAIPGDLLEAYRQTASRIVLNLDAHRPWFLKEPRLCLTFPVWRTVLEMPFCVHIVRNPLEVAHSLKARNGIPIKAGLALWEVYNKRAIAYSSTLPRVFVTYADLMQEAHSVAERLAGALASQSGYSFRIPSPVELDAFIDQKLHRQRADESSFPSTVTRSQIILYERLKEATENDQIDVPPVGKACISTLRRFESSGEHLAARMRRSNDLEQASPEDADPRLTLKRMELSRALADLANQKTALQSKDQAIDNLRKDLHEHKTQLALRNQRVDQLTSELKRVESRLAASKSLVEQQKAEARQLVEQHRTEARKNQDVVATLNDTLKSLQRSSRNAVRNLTEENVQLARRNEELTVEHKRIKRELVDTNSRQGDLVAGIADILASRRWRLGHFLLSLPYRLLFRRVPPMATDTIDDAVGKSRQATASSEGHS